MNNKGRVLVVDDEDRLRETMTRILERGGYVADAAPDGLAALEKLASQEFDVVILDMKMPGLSGAETFQNILQRGFDVETICLTGHVSTEEAMDMIQQGMFDYLLKPAAPTDILKKVEQAIESKRLRNGEINLDEILRHSTDDL